MLDHGQFRDHPVHRLFGGWPNGCRSVPGAGRGERWGERGRGGEGRGEGGWRMGGVP